jgi:hypothetical protein
MARKKNTFDTKVNPRRRQIGKRNAPIFLSLVHVGFVYKTVDPISKPKKTFVICSIVLKSDFRIDFQKGRQKGGRCIRIVQGNRRRRNESGHLVQRNRRRRTVIKQNGILWDRGGAERVERKGNVHDSTSQEHIGRGVNALDPRAWRVLFLKGRIIVSKQTAEQTTIVTKRGIDRTWKAITVEPIAVRLVILSIPGIVNQESVGGGGPTDDHSVHGVSHVFGAGIVAILIMVEVAKRENW